MDRVDTLVLGAGIVGLSSALHLQARGRNVVLVDRAGAGEGTSFGNAGIIERASIYPYAFPRRMSDLVAYAFNRRAEARYDPFYLPRLAPWLARYWWHSSPERHVRAMRGALPLIERSLLEHEPLIEAAGAQHLLTRNGWLKLFRTPALLERADAEARRLASFGITHDLLDRHALAIREPHLSGDVIGAVHYRDPACIRDPGALSKAYLDLFLKRGGHFRHADARSLRQSEQGWQVGDDQNVIRANEVVVALGPWSDLVTQRFGYRVPLAVKRGYHMHYSPAGNAVLNHTLLDAENGYVLAPMAAGIRLTTGAEFVARDARPSPYQLDRVEPCARALFPLAARVDREPWMGCRPCLPDMLPVIGSAPGHKGLWFCFGHAHHGLTLGPVSGRLLAEMMTDKDTFTDPMPYSIGRFA